MLRIMMAKCSYGMILWDDIIDDNDEDGKNDNSINASGLKRTLFPDGEKAMSKAIRSACECPSLLVDVIQFVAGLLVMSVEGSS